MPLLAWLRHCCFRLLYSAAETNFQLSVFQLAGTPAPQTCAYQSALPPEPFSALRSAQLPYALRAPRFAFLPSPFSALPLCAQLSALCRSPSSRPPVSGLRSPVSRLRSPFCVLRLALRALPVSGLRSPVSGLRFPVSGLRSPVSVLRFALCALRSVYVICFDGTGILLDFTRLSDNISGSVIFPPDKIPVSLMAATGRSSTVSRLNRLPTIVP